MARFIFIGTIPCLLRSLAVAPLRCDYLDFLDALLIFDGFHNAAISTELAEKMSHRERFLLVLHDLTGRHVVVHKMNGSTEKGIFHSVSAIAKKGEGYTFVFKGAKKAAEGKQLGGYRSVFIKADEIAQIEVPSIALKENMPRGTGGGFATDTDISSNSAAHLSGRELQGVNNAWLDKSLEDASQFADNGQPWDQFEANFKLTGRKAEYDESMYTTSLDTSKVSGCSGPRSCVHQCASRPSFDGFGL